MQIMPDSQRPDLAKQVRKTFPDSNWFERPETEPSTPFEQMASPDNDDSKDFIAPHELFCLFTFDIIQAKKVFIR